MVIICKTPQNISPDSITETQNDMANTMAQPTSWKGGATPLPHITNHSHADPPAGYYLQLHLGPQPRDQSQRSSVEGARPLPLCPLHESHSESVDINPSTHGLHAGDCHWAHSRVGIGLNIGVPSACSRADSDYILPAYIFFSSVWLSRPLRIAHGQAYSRSSLTFVS